MTDAEEVTKEVRGGFKGWFNVTLEEANEKETLRLANLHTSWAWQDDPTNEEKAKAALKARAAYLEMLARDHLQAASEGIAPAAMTMLGKGWKAEAEKIEQALIDS